METEIEFKTVSVAGIKDDGEGIVEAIVSVTGIVDNVKDIIEPGSYEKTLVSRKPKGVWHHSWTDPVSKTLDIKELMPGDSMLPKKLPNGQPWPAEAGALWVKTQFNLQGDRGRQAYADVKFFGDEQEWSIGYNVPQGGAVVEQKSGIRRIKTLDLYEYSPVLFGAMPSARTQGGVKEAQLAFKALGGWQFKSDEPPQDAGEGVGLTEDEENELTDDLDEALDPEDFDLPEEADEKSLVGLLTTNRKLDPAKIRTAIKALKAVLDDYEDEDEDDEEEDEEKSVPIPFLQLKAMEYASFSECVADLPLLSVPSVKKLAEEFDTAVKSDDADKVQEAAENVLTELEAISDEDEDGEKVDEIAMATTMLSRLLATGEEKSLSDQRSALLNSLEDDDLRDLGQYAWALTGHSGIKSAISMELDERGVLTSGARTRTSVKAVKPKPKKNVSKDRRARAADEGNTAYGDSYPIENTEDLKNAIQAVGRAKDPDAAKAWIKKKAKELGKEDMLPESWQEKSLIPLEDFEAAGIDIKSMLVS